MAASLVARLPIALGASALLVLASPVLSQESPPSSTLPGNGKIAYTLSPGPGSAGDGQSTIHLIDPDGSNDSSLSEKLSDFSFVGTPSWSPDGVQLTFSVTTTLGAPEQIYAINADGNGLRNLTGNSPMWKGPPSWSPDGSSIAFLGSSDSRTGLYMMDPDGGNQVLVADVDANPSSLSWSPDGSRIAYNNKYDLTNPNTDIYVMNSDGTGHVRLTDAPGFDGGPGWSPDGSKIVFMSKRDTLSGALYLMNADGSDQRLLIANHRCAPPAPPASPSVCLGDEYPVWSPDGNMIAFVGFANDGGFSDIFVVNSDGTNERRLTHTPDFEWIGAWQPIPVGDTPTPTLVLPPTPSSPAISSAQPDSCAEPSSAASPTPTPLTLSGSPSPPSSPTTSPSPAGTSIPLATSTVTAFPDTTPSMPKANGVTPPANSPREPEKDELPKPTRPDPIIGGTTPEPSGFAAPSLSPAPQECQKGESGTELTAQAVGLIALGVLVVGSALALPLAALRRRRL